MVQGENLQRKMMEVLYYLLAYHERSGEVKRAIELAYRQVDIEPWREETHRDLMRLLALDGQRSAALAQYKTCQLVLEEELNAEPTAETSALYRRIAESDGRPPLNHTRAGIDYLPPAPGPLIGREVESAELADLIADPACRLVTLVGPGGIGKTHLALQTAVDHVGLFCDGVFFVPLAALDTAEHLVPTLATVLNYRFHDATDPEQQLSDFMREKELLLVLDNLEHLLAAVDFLARVLNHAPGVTLLVTSRERLNLREEWVYELEGLDYPAEGWFGDWDECSSVALFVERAQRVARRFELTEQQVPFVTRICQLVEGMPLAVELAAAWMRLRTPEEVAVDIERNLDTLSSSASNVPTRHASLRATFEHSWRLLTTEEQFSLGNLSVFRGGFDESAAGQVAGTLSATLIALVDKSLVRRNGSGRYDLHRLMHQFVNEKLNINPQQQQAIANAYKDYFADFLQQQELQLRGARQTEALVAIAAEIDNIRAAWRQALAQNDTAAIGRSLTSLGMFYLIRGWHREGAEALRQAIQTLPEDGIVLAVALAWHGRFLHQLGEYTQAQQSLEKSLEMLRLSSARRENAFSLYALADLCYHATSEYDQARKHYQESLALYQQLGDAYGEAQCLDGLGDIAIRQGDFDQARQFYEQGLALRRQIGDQWGISVSLGSLGGLAGRQGAFDDAQRWFEESLALGRELGNSRGIAASLHNLSTLAYIREEYAEAKRLRLETLTICRQIGYRWGIASALKSLGDVAGRMGDYDEARQLLQESLDILAETGDRRSQAFTLNSLGTVTLLLNLDQEALGFFQQALAAALAIQEPALALDVLLSVAQIKSQSGEMPQALELLEFIRQHPAAEIQTKEKIEPLWASLTSQLPDGAVESAKTQGRQLSLDTIQQMLDRP